MHINVRSICISIRTSILKKWFLNGLMNKFFFLSCVQEAELYRGKDTGLGVNRTELETLFYCVNASGIGKLFNFSEP